MAVSLLVLRCLEDKFVVHLENQSALQTVSQQVADAYHGDFDDIRGGALNRIHI